MKHTTTKVLTLAAAGCALSLQPVVAQEQGDASTTPATFAAPVRIQAGEGLLGEGRLYPSPAMFDVDGDKRPDLVIGDLFGKVTFAPRSANEDRVEFGSDKPFKDRSGNQLKFENW